MSGRRKQATRGSDRRDWTTSGSLVLRLARARCCYHHVMGQRGLWTRHTARGSSKAANPPFHTAVSVSQTKKNPHSQPGPRRLTTRPWPAPLARPLPGRQPIPLAQPAVSQHWPLLPRASVHPPARTAQTPLRRPGLYRISFPMRKPGPPTLCPLPRPPLPVTLLCYLGVFKPKMQPALQCLLLQQHSRLCGERALVPPPDAALAPASAGKQMSDYCKRERAEGVHGRGQ